MDLRDNNPQKKWKNREFTASFEFALTGIITAFKEERNMRKHLVSAISVVVACYAVITGMIVFIPKIWHLIFN